MHSRHVKAVDNREVRLHIDLRRVRHLGVVGCAELEDLVRALKGRQGDER